jgi:hypothetical protein
MRRSHEVLGACRLGPFVAADGGRCPHQSKAIGRTTRVAQVTADDVR